MSDNMDEPYPQPHHPNGYCEGSGICTHCGRTLFDEYFKPPVENKSKPQVGPVPIGSNNQDLIDQTKRVHGELYHRLNSIQRDLNITRESLRKTAENLGKSRSYITSLEEENNDRKKLVEQLYSELKVYKHAANYGMGPTEVRVQFPNEPEVIYKLVRE